jgi:hypothetical protein
MAEEYKVALEKTEKKVSKPGRLRSQRKNASRSIGRE